MTDVLVPDASQYQGVIDHAALVAYLRRTYGGAAGIFRLDYGDLAVDTYADRNIDAARAAGWDVLGWYCYLVKGRPVEPQADTFCRILQAHGGLCPGEVIVVDDEESTGGDESGRVNAFLARCDANLKTPNPAGEDWWYSGLNFAVAHNLPAARGHRIIAAYQASEPTAVPHDMWQKTDAASLPGVNGPIDASVFHGSIDDLRRLIGAPGGSPLDPQLLAKTLVRMLYLICRDAEPETQAALDGWAAQMLANPEAALIAMVDPATGEFAEELSTDRQIRADYVAGKLSQAGAAGPTGPPGPAYDDTAVQGRLAKVEADIVAIKAIP